MSGSAKQMSRYRKFWFYVLTVFLMFIGIEFALHVVHLAVKGTFFWNLCPGEFNVRGFSKPVSDSRYVTIIPNYSIEKYQEGALQWGLSTDEFGFRKGSYNTNNTGKNIVFIGDSVLFGWGVGDSETIPSHLGQILKKEGIDYGIINAAMPSYSLDQAVQRYKQEIANRFQGTYIVLEAYDPASQFALFGREWDPSRNWTTQTPLMRIQPLEKKFICESVVYNLLWRKLASKESSYYQEKLDIHDQEAASKYVQAIRSSLDDLVNSSPRATRIFLISIAISESTLLQLSHQRLYSIELMRKTLEQFAASHPDKVTFLDARTLFQGQQNEKNFLDCCHVTPLGAQLQAKKIYDLLKLQK